jgi:hypothetical protein
MTHYRFVEPVIVESDDALDSRSSNKRRHRFTNERITVVAEGNTVSFVWRGASWSVERKYLARVITD